MPLLKIGIVENVSFSKSTGIDDEGNRVIVMQVKPSKEEIVQALIEGKVLEPAQSSLRQFLPNLKTQKGEAKTSVELVAEYMKFQEMLLNYAKLLAPEEEVIAAMGGAKAFTNIGITEDAMATAIERFTDEAFLEKMFNSIFTLFSNFITSIENLEEIKFRHKFWRASKKKAFAAIPTGGKPFVESMQIPTEQSEIGWSAWELENKKNSDAEVAADKPRDEAAPEAEDMFAPPAEQAPQPDLLDMKEE